MIKDLLNEGFVLKSQGYYKHSIEVFYKVLELDNTSVEVLYEIAESYYSMGEVERALNYLEQVLDSCPSHIEGLKLLEKIFISKGAWGEAEQTAKNIYLISPMASNLAEIFSLLNKQKKYSELLEYQIENSNADVYYELAYACYSSDNCEKAEKFIDLALGKTINNKYLFLKGKILCSLNKMAECENLINSIDFDNSDAETLNFVGLVKVSQGASEDGVNYFLRAITLEPEKAEYYYNCANAYFNLREFNQAKKYYNFALSISPEEARYRYALASLYRNVGS
jgi:tetratricopeptide (TPR) repeat protein